MQVLQTAFIGRKRGALPKGGLVLFVLPYVTKGQVLPSVTKRACVTKRGLILPKFTSSVCLLIPSSE